MTWLRNAAIGLACAVAILAPPAIAQTTEWRKVGASLRQITDLAAIEQFARDHPNSGNVHLALLNAYLDAGMKDAAWREVEFLLSRGYRFSDAGQAELLSAFQGGARAKLEEWLAADPGLAEASAPVATVPVEALLVEGATLDARSGRLFASTIVSRALYVRGAAGEWTTIELSGAGSLASMALDADRRILWVASGLYDETPEPRRGLAGVFGLDLETGRVISKTAPEGATPSDIALATDGGLYASDPLSGAIYHAGADSEQMRLRIGPGTFRSPQGLVPWGDGVIVSDYGYGLAFVDKGGTAWRIDSDVPVLLDGIDGMWRHGERIVAVQNGVRPSRIIELAMAADGRRVTGVRDLERAHSAWTEPVGGAIVGNSLLYVANSQWPAFGPGGIVREGAVAQPTELRLLPLGESPAPTP